MTRPARQSPAQMQAACDRFNARYKPGDTITVYTGLIGENPKSAEVRYPAEIMGGRTANGCGIGSPVSASRVHLTRASAIDAAVSWVRRVHGADVSPALSAWLDGLARVDLFVVAA